MTNKTTVPLEAIGKILAEVMEQAVKNGADSRSMPDDYVAVAHFTCFPEKYALAAAPVQAQEPRPELTVWYGAMPESNGKSNFTAILMRSAEGWDGPHVTIERSEYPDRIRYEADRVRHLIGEMTEEPDILAYDADKRSDYIALVPPVAVPDGWIVTIANSPGGTVFQHSRFMPLKRNAEVCAEQWRKETPFYHIEVVDVFFGSQSAQGEALNSDKESKDGKG